ncbi:MAG: membrane protein [Hyphococcus sp.]|nr:MAG: membrane protein [Marinicaulis sp.]
MKLKTTLLAAAASVCVAPAAHAYDGLYGAIGAGINYMKPDTDVSNDGAGGSGPIIFDSDSDYDHGVGIYAALGKHLGSGFRGEFEVAYRNNDIRHIAPVAPTFAGFPAGTISGDTSTYSFMLNVLYDFNNVSSAITPYIGAGIGLAVIDNDISGINLPGNATSPGAIAYGSDGSTGAIQGIAGVAIQLAEQLSLDLSYRYFVTDKKEYSGAINGVASNIAAEYATHSLFAGLRWDFGASTPPVQYKDCWDGSSVPMAAECPPQIIEEQTADLDPVDFTVYFDYDKANLTPQASTLISEASSRALQNNIDTVVVAGNTDTSGSSAYNQALSERRARVVRDALIANGVSADAIRMEAFGESNPAKPTADGVREPLNRRSEVSISFE